MPGQTFSFRSSNNLGVDSKVLIGLTSLDVHNSISDIPEKNNKFELYTVDEFSFTEVNNALEEILDISIISPHHLQNKIIGPRIFKSYKSQKTENRLTDGYYMFLMGYARSPF